MNIFILRNICSVRDRLEIDDIKNICIELCKTPLDFYNIDKDPVESCKNLALADVVINIEDNYVDPSTMSSVFFQLAKLTKKTLISVKDLNTALTVICALNPRK